MTAPGVAPELATLAAQVHDVFQDIHGRVFRGDPAANPRLQVQVVAAVIAHDTPAVLLLTPWTCNGLAFPADGSFPGEVVVAGRPLAARPVRVGPLGLLWSVNLVPDVSRFASQETAIRTAASWAEPWQLAVSLARAGAVPAPATPAGRPQPRRTDVPGHSG